MRARVVLAPVLVAGLALSASAAQAESKTLDGKKTKKLTFTATSGPQENDPWLVGDVAAVGGQTLPAPFGRVSSAECAPPLCAVWDFSYKPAKGIAGGLMLTARWGSPTSDIDLSLVQYEKDGSRTEIASCGGSGGTAERIYADPTMLKTGKKYALVAMNFRTVSETVTGTVEINVPSTIKPTTGEKQFDCAL